MAEPSGGILNGLIGALNVFIDPAETARRVPSKWSWVWPLLLLCLGYLVFAYMLLPYTLQLMDATLAQRNVPSENMERASSMMHAATKITTPLTPAFIIGFLALEALLIKVLFAMMDNRPRFRDVFSLLAACSLIPFLQYALSYVVLRIKGDPVESPEQMTPPFGLDIFLPHLHGPAFAFISFFSIFEIWFIVVLVIGLAHLTHTSKTKSLIASIPAWLLPLAMKLVSSLFQRSPAA